jgi:hypothetical protein
MYRSDFDFVTKHPILQKHFDLLQQLNDDRVMCVCYQENKEGKEFYIEEQCDGWFKHTLTKKECIELSELFKEIADNI